MGFAKYGWVVLRDERRGLCAADKEIVTIPRLCHAFSPLLSSAMSTFTEHNGTAVQYVYKKCLTQAYNYIRERDAVCHAMSACQNAPSIVKAQWPTPHLNFT